ncbi:MAG: hypothetical protein J6U64_01660, partial [Alphaproteobacteria bacterium]|nr:hypothetical protein [Alphaproteobacteria bacterium]
AATIPGYHDFKFQNILDEDFNGELNPLADPDKSWTCCAHGTIGVQSPNGHWYCCPEGYGAIAGKRCCHPEPIYTVEGSTEQYCCHYNNGWDDGTRYHPDWDGPNSCVDCQDMCDDWSDEGKCIKWVEVCTHWAGCC